MTTETPVALTAADARAVLADLADAAGELSELADSLPEEVKLPDLTELAGLVDAAIERLAQFRGELDRRARPAYGWRSNRYTHPLLGWRAERTRNVRKVWDLPRAFGRVAPFLRVDPETGEVDLAGVTAAQLELALERFARVASISGLKTRALNDLQVPFEDLVTEERNPDRIRVVRDVAAGGAR